MFAPYRFERSASTKDLCRFCLRAGVFLGHHSRGDWTDVRFRIPVCSTTRVKSATVLSLMIDGCGSAEPRTIFGILRPSGACSANAWFFAWIARVAVLDLRPNFVQDRLHSG